MATTTEGPEGGQAHVIARLTGALAGALDRAADAPAWSMTAEEQRGCLVGLARVQARMSELRLRVLAATRAGLAGGRVNEEQAQVIVRAVDELPERVTDFDRRRAEAHLIEAAAERDAKELRLRGRRIFEVLDPEAAEAEEGKRLAKEEREARRKTFLKMFDNGDGSYTGSFKLPAARADAEEGLARADLAPGDRNRRPGQPRRDQRRRT